MLIVVITIGLVACKSTNDDLYTSKIIDVTNDGLGISTETNIWTGTYFTKDNMKDKTCTANGESYTGSYKKSIVEKTNSYTTDIYIDENDIEFGLRDDNGKLTYINYMNKEFFDTVPYLPDTSNPYETAITIAADIADDYLKNINEYTQIIDEPKSDTREKDGITYEMTYYFITYARKVSGYFTSDYITVKVTSKGKLASIKMGDIDVFENTNIDINKELIDDSISNKIDITYKKIKFDVKTTDITDQKLVVTPDGEICVTSKITIEGTKEDGTETKTGIYLNTIVKKDK